MVKWFVQENDEVRGPFSQEEVKAQAENGVLSNQCLLWSRGMSQWTHLSNWPKAAEQGKALNGAHEKMWHYALDNQPYGPISQTQLIQQMKNLNEEVHQVLLWTKGMRAWAPIYDFHDIMDELGINRRQQPRATISGKVVVHLESKQLIGTLKTISEGGFGAERLHGLVPGQTVRIEIHSDHFLDPLHCKADVRYISETGFVGFTFISIDREAVSTIIQYVKSAVSKLKAA